MPVNGHYEIMPRINVLINDGDLPLVPYYAYR